MPASTASCLPPDKAKEAVIHVIETVLGFDPCATCPLWLALINDATDESRVNVCNQWLWLTKEEIAALQCRPDPTKQKVVALSRGHHTHVTRFKAMRDNLRADPTWTDLDILKITYEEYMAFSRRYFSGQVTENPSPSPSPAERLMIERAADSAPLSSEPRKLLAIPTYVPPGKEAVYAALPTSDNVDSNAKENVELAASHSSFESADKAAPSTLFNMDPQLSLFHGGHQVVPAVKLKMTPYDTIGRTPLQTSDLSASAMRTFSDELDSALSCDEFSVATMTTQCFDKHGIERDFYSLMPLHGENLKEQSCDTRLCDPSCHSTLRMPTQDHGEDLTSDARSYLISTSEVWLLNENTKSTFGSHERRLSVATFLEVTSDSSLPSSSTVLRDKTMILFCTDPRISTRATSVNASVLPRDLCRGENMSLYADICPLAVQVHGEMFTGQRRSSRIDIVGQVSASALGAKFPLTLIDETTFPSESKELCGQRVGTSENVGHFMTCKILTDDARRITRRSYARSADDSCARNLRLDPLNDEPPEVIRSLHKSSPTSDHGEDFSLHSAGPAGENPFAAPTSERRSNEGEAIVVDPQELVGCTFLMDTQEDGQSFRASVVECISERESNARRSGDHVKFRISVNEDEYEEIITCNELMESSGSAARPFAAVPNRAGCFGGAAVEDDDKDISCLFPDLAEFVLDLQSNFERSIAEVLANDRVHCFA